jgi:predicted HicB family RNase H-like nuclease
MLYNGATQGDTALGQLLNRAKDVVTESLEELLHACRNRLSESQRADAFEQAASVAVQELRSAW